MTATLADRARDAADHAPRRARARRRRAGERCSPQRRRRRSEPERARHLGLRRSQISRRTSSISTTSIRTRRRAACSRRSGPAAQFNQNFLTFNSLNSFILKGDARAGHASCTFATLMAPSTVFAPTHDEPDAMYGLAARAVRISADGLTYRFLMRPEATFPRRHAAHRARCRLLAQAAQGEGPSDHRAAHCATSSAPRRSTTPRWSLRFAPKRARDVPLFVAQLPIFSRAYYAEPSIRRDRRSRRRSAPGPTRSAVSRPAASSNTSA